MHSQGRESDTKKKGEMRTESMTFTQGPVKNCLREGVSRYTRFSMFCKAEKKPNYISYLGEKSS